MTIDLPVRTEPWFDVETVGPGIRRIHEPAAGRLMRAGMFLIAGRSRDLLFDTGLGVADLARRVRSLTSKPLVVVASHAHLDHIGGHHQFSGEEILAHPREAALLARPDPAESLSCAQFGAAAMVALADLGFDTARPLLDALPSADFDVAGFRAQGIAPTGLIDEGDVIDLGDRAFEVLHLPGHSPGSIGLIDRRTGVLLAGDAIYEGTIVDSLPGSDIEDYRGTMRRLIDLPVEIVHGGHNAAFGRARLVEIARAYLSSREGAETAS